MLCSFNSLWSRFEPPDESNRSILVTLAYAPREPNRYMFMRARVIGLNAPDQARLTLGVEYEDGGDADQAAQQRDP